MRRSIVLVCVIMLVVHLCYNAQAAPHKSVEEDEDNSSSSDEVTASTEDVSKPTPIIIIVVPDPTKHEGNSHEVKSREEEEDNSSQDADPRHVEESDEEDDTVKQPKTESLCPARPEEITKIEAECAKEFMEWKERRAKKLQAETTTVEAATVEAATVEAATVEAATVEAATEVASEITTENTPIVTSTATSTATSEVTTDADVETVTCETLACEMEAFDALIDTYRSIKNQETLAEVINVTEVVNASSEDIEMSVLERELWNVETTIDMDIALTTELPEETTTTMSPTTTTMLTTMRPVRRNSKHKRSTKNIRKKKVRSCYPATCILRKLNLLDSMSQPSIALIQSFAVNMTVDDSTNLEEKAVGCVKEINEAMIDASGDFGRKVGCIAQKVITCLNKGLTCPIMKVPQ